MQETNELVERYYAAFNRADKQSMLDCVSEDVVHDVNQGAARHGKALFDAFFDHMARCYREHLTDIVIMTTPDGARAAIEFTVNGEYLADDEGLPPANGQRYCLPAGCFMTISDNKISRITTYYNLQEWSHQVLAE